MEIEQSIETVRRMKTDARMEMDNIDLDRRKETTKRMERRKQVSFCVHAGNNTCKKCENAFRSKSSQANTSYHQIEKDLTCFSSRNSTTMIVDLGCPNSVISEKDKDFFIQNLSKFQQ